MPVEHCTRTLPEKGDRILNLAKSYVLWRGYLHGGKYLSPITNKQWERVGVALYALIQLDFVIYSCPVLSGNC